MPDSISKHILDIQVRLTNQAKINQLKTQLNELGYEVRRSKEHFTGFDTGVNRLGGSMSNLRRPAAQAAQMFTVWSGSTLMALHSLNSLRFGVIKFKAELIDLYFIGSLKMQAFFGLLAVPVKAIDSFAKFESAVHSAQTAGLKWGVSTAKTNALIEQSMKRNLVSVQGSSAAIKELLQAGYTPEVIDPMMKSLEAMALMAKQSGLSVEQALKTTAEGFRFFRPVLMDNTGATQNADVTLQAYAKTINKTVKELTNLEKRTALSEWIIREGYAYEQALENMEDSTTRRLAQLQLTWDKIKIELGSGLAPVVKDLIKELPKIIQFLADVVLQIALIVQGFITWGKIANNIRASIDPLGGSVLMFDAAGKPTGMSEGTKPKSMSALIAEHEAAVARLRAEFTGLFTDPLGGIKPVGGVTADIPEDSSDLTKKLDSELASMQQKLGRGMSNSISDAMYNVFAGDQAKSLQELILSFWKGIGRGITDILGQAIANAFIKSNMGQALTGGLTKVVNAIGGGSLDSPTVDTSGLATQSAGSLNLAGLGGRSSPSQISTASNTYNINFSAKVSALDGADATKVLTKNSKVIASQLVDEINKSKKLSDRIRRG